MDNVDINKFDSNYRPKIKTETKKLKSGIMWDNFKLINLFDGKGTITTKVENLNSYGNGYYTYITTQGTNNGVKIRK
ncbi:MAG TPA: hypothetical protein VIM70_15195 [Clostridium sp.]|uniref:hypothetical protein n=1 Tax=Clostridium sp. TaxID=1506 RepID=UPI002F95A57D